MRKLVTLAGAVIVGTVCLVQNARAQSNDSDKVAAAQALYDEAVVAMDAKDYAKACPKLAEAVRLVPEGIGAKLTLAECFEASGKLASAWSQYAVAASMADRAGQKERAASASARANDLKGKLAYLTIEVPRTVSAIPKVSITRGDVQVGEGQWFTPLPIDVGTYEIVVTAPGYKQWMQQIVIAKDGESAKIRVEAPPIDQSEKAAEERKQAAKIVFVEQAAKRPWQKPLGFALIGVGGASLVAGAVVGVLAIQKNSEANDGPCNAKDICTYAGVDLRHNAVALGNGSTIAVVVGGTLALGGVVLVATSQAKGKENNVLPSGLAATIEVVPSGLRLRGTF